MSRAAGRPVALDNPRGYASGSAALARFARLTVASHSTTQSAGCEDAERAYPTRLDSDSIGWLL